MIDTLPDIVILDVRSPLEFNSGHIEGAKLIPASELEDRLHELDKGKKIIVYCSSEGCSSGGRSSKASLLLAENGFGSVYNMLGGIMAWEEAGYPLSAPVPS